MMDVWWIIPEKSLRTAVADIYKFDAYRLIIRLDRRIPSSLWNVDFYLMTPWR
jgi:hypothetical protein